MNQKYLFADETASFMQPPQPAKGAPVILRFQTAKDDSLLSVRLIHNDTCLEMSKKEIVGELAFYEIEIPAVTETYTYCFEVIERGGKWDPAIQRQQARRVFFNKKGVVSEPEEKDNFVIRPGFEVPEWLQGAVMYQIFVDRFRNGDRANSVLDGEYLYLNRFPVRRVTDWNKCPEALDVNCFYGGDLQGIWDKLDYLQDLGVEVLYLNPIFVSPSNHKYDSQDYDYVDPHLARIVQDGGDLLPDSATSNRGATRYRQRVATPANLEASNAFFAEFVREVHRRGMKIILDGVFNHCGSFHRWMDREGIYRNSEAYGKVPGAWHSENSPYREYFKFTGPKTYESWWDLDTLPKLNYENSERLQHEILRIAKKWVSPPYSVDGWRLDVAADLGHSEAFNHSFWKKFRTVVKEANPDAVILAEHYGDVSPWLGGDEWDTVMNYDAFMEPVSWFLTGMDKHSDTFRGDLLGNSEAFFASMRRNMRPFPGGSLLGAMNELDNHDHSRFLTRTNHQCGRVASRGSAAAGEGIHYGVLRQAVVMQMTWPGAPTLYYGDETGVCGWTDPDSRRTYPWGQENWDLIEFYKYAIGMHHRHPALRTGSVVPLLSEPGLLAYGRFQEGDRLVILVNTDQRERTATVDTAVMGCSSGSHYRRIMVTWEEGYNVGVAACESIGTRLTVNMPPVSSLVLWEQ
ncbi:MAG: glycoside hydrolase family 13 protein [Lachnospiraceae bacterium]|nr:glycoside hydrolase family 13 protein [Lachnospiraceae bacterium]